MELKEKDTGTLGHDLARSVKDAGDLVKRVSAAQEDLRQTLVGASRHLTAYGSCVDSPATFGYVDARGGMSMSASQLFVEISTQIWEQISLAENRRGECAPEQDAGQLLDYTCTEDTDPAGMVDAYEDAVFEGIRACMLLGIRPEHFDAAAAIAEAYGLCNDEKTEAIRRAFD